MKIIILSDVKSKSESVIPYGLRVARALESEADVLHVIDDRLQDGHYSPHSDSQSITPGETLSKNEVIQREKNRANIMLDNLLSREASRLNYPLKVNRIIKVNRIEDELAERAKENPENIFVINSKANNYTFNSTDDVLSTVRNAGCAALLVTPDMSFKNFERVVLPLNFETELFDFFRDVKFLFENFEVSVDAVTLSNKKNYYELELKADAWKKVAKDYVLPNTSLKANVLEGKSFKDAIIDYTQKNKPDLITIFQEKGKNKAVFKNNELEILLKNTNIPVLLYS